MSGVTGKSNEKITASTNNGSEIEDEFCLPQKPVKVTIEDVQKASAVVKTCMEPTPCQKSKLSDRLGMTVYFKKEFLQYTGSFKERGARYALSMLNDSQKKKGVVAASLGNHSQGLSYHSKLMNIPCTVVMPKAAPYNKIQKCRNFGADVIVYGKDIAEARNFAMSIAKEKEMTYINGYDHPHIIAGQGTIGLEILEQIKDADAIVVPIGGGGLIAGIAVAAKSLRKDIKIIGVETENTKSFSNAITNGGPIYTPCLPTLADGLAVPTVGYNAYATVKPLLDKMVVIHEKWIAPAILHLVELEKSVVEGAGASGLAAILAGELNEFQNKKVVVVLCGGNIDTNTFGRCLERGLIAMGQLLRFSVTVIDKPGSLAALCTLTSSAGVSIIDVVQERQFMPDIHNVQIKVICETRDSNHSEEFKKLIQQNYDRVMFNDASMNVPK